MFNLFKRKNAKGESALCPAGSEIQKSRICDVGWIVDLPSAGFVYSAPRPVLKKSNITQGQISTKGVNACPSILDLEAKTYEVLCPVDMKIRFAHNKEGKPVLINVDQQPATINAKHLDRMITLVDRDRWRDPKRPVVQISTPYRFIADEPVWLNQWPACLHFRKQFLPGVLVCGRYPIDVWPRGLMWAFEWHDTSQDLILERGEPWFLVRFEINDPSRPIRLFEAEMTPELRHYCNGLDAVTNYVNQTYQLMAEARRRRPAVLLKKADRPGAPEDNFSNSDLHSDLH